MPDTVQMVLALLVLNVNAVRPLLAIAVRVIGVTPNVTGDAGAKVTVWLARTGVTLLDGVEAAPAPIPLVATTVKV